MSDLPGRLAAALGTAYRLEDELGGGGMSRVFRAEEVALGRQVVIKVLPPDMGAGVNEDRFRREVQLAARLQHPHIVPLLAAGSANGLLWYAMPYVEGESLRARLAREGELPVAEAVRILREVTDALAYAHEKGVVHRDIKPDNVMISGSHAMVTDFGVAKAVSDAVAGGGALTSLGVALGTPAYMAPEQAAADPHVDQRADLYALGAMGYEMLTGRPPFSGPTPQAVLSAHMIQVPERPSALRPAVHPALEAILLRCLEKRPADRWQRAADLLPHLDALRTPTEGTAPVPVSMTVSSGTERALQQTHPVRVAALFAIGAMALLSLTWWLVQKLGLPDWVVIAAGGLVLIGLPVVLLAAGRERERLRARSEGRIGHVPAGLVGRMTTLRGALAGGGLAFGGLAIGTTVFMTLRSLGIGPFATLLSAGVLEDRGLLVVADFQTAAEDSSLAASITEALKIDLGQSPSVRVLEGRAVTQALERMQKPATTPVDAATAQEIAQREGAKAVVMGEVSRLGAGFVLSVRLLSSADGTTLLGVRETAPDQAGLIAAVDRISRELREGIGESLQSIRSSQPLDQVTTASLEALRLYTRAERVRQLGRLEEGRRLLEQAIAVDSGFAMAWRKLSVALFPTGEDPELEFAAAQRAYDLRERLPRREAELAAASYFTSVGRRSEAIQAYQRMLETWPDDGPAQNNLALLLNLERRYPEAERILRAAIDSGGTTIALFDNLIDAQLWQRRPEAAESTAVRFARTVPDAVDPARYFAYVVAFSRGQYDKADSLANVLLRSEDGVYRSVGEEGRLRLLTLGGQLRSAREMVDRDRPDLEREGAVRNRDLLEIEANQALLDGVVRGRPDEGGQRLAQAIARYPLDSVPLRNRDYPDLIATAVALDRKDLVATLDAAYAKTPGTGRFVEGNRARVRALVALSNGNWATAVSEARLAQERGGCPVCALPLIGDAFDRGGQPDSARVAYEEYLTRRIYFSVGQEVEYPRIMVRLGELYEGTGDKARAIEYYSQFVELWKNTDPDLQPRVDAIRKRIGQLAREP